MSDKNLLKKLAAAVVIYAAFAGLVFATPLVNNNLVFNGWKSTLSAGCIYFVLMFLSSFLAGVSKKLLPELIDANRKALLNEFLDGPAAAGAVLVVSSLAPSLITFDSVGGVLFLGVLLGVAFALVEWTGQLIDRRAAGRMK